MEFNQYFRSYSDYFWQWEEHASVIAIPNESTIAYREFILEIFERIAPQGIPPFGTLLLAIIASNPNGANSIDAVYALLSRGLPDSELTMLTDAMTLLKLITEVPASYKQGKKRILLLQAIFERSHKLLSSKKSINLYQDFLTCAKNSETFTAQTEVNPNTLRIDFRPLALLKNRFPDVNSIIAKIAFVPEIPEEIDVPLSEATKATDEKELIKLLVENNKTFYVGSLVRRIWSGLDIPVHSSQPSMQPLGGISDLTNKGDFDKLLISEFANDDIVFLSRLANNEALYIHREIPPSKNDLQRILLIDVSLKNWGTPKTIAFATMLAIAKHPKTNISCSVFAVGHTCTPVSFENVDTIIDGLQVLEGCLNCCEGLAAFFKEHPTLPNSEIFFITETSTVKQPDMLRAMHEHAMITYWIYTDTQGNIDVFRKQQKSRKHIQHIQLPLEELWKKTILLPRAEEKRISLLIPLLLRSPIKHKKIMTTSDGAIFQATGDNVLLKSYKNFTAHNSKGWELLAEQIPFALCDLEIGLFSNGDYVLLMYHFTNKEITLLNITTSNRKTIPFQHWQRSSHLGFVFHDQKFYHNNNRGCWSVDGSGNVEDVVNLDKVIFINRQKELQSTAQKYLSGKDGFRNINVLFINQTNNLVFNVHELALKNGDHCKLEKTGFLRKEIEATKNEHGFVFNDGSTIEMIRAGVIILKSSDASIPYIYISSVVNASIGMCTENFFAGNEYYNKSQNTITVTDFYKKYIDRFILNILRTSKK